ncbi:pilin N-terminal domain-containing protein [Blautia sp. CLA-JM-H16]|uniref:Pilin N-terminal domain-containing protein n=1 Tax=Blautia aquisgranensis TaxID=3133153 RepID=A0ABV1BI58_9FIRM
MEKRTKRKNFLSSFLAILVMAVMLTGSMAQEVLADDYVAGKTGNINLTIQETGEDGTVKPIPNVKMTLYKVGSVTFDGNVHFVADNALQFTEIDFENLKTADEWYKTAETLSAAVKRADFNGSEMQSDAEGKIVYSNVAEGVYLIVQSNPDDPDVSVSPMVLTVPFAEESTGWTYDVQAYPKAVTHEGDKETQIQVTKQLFYIDDAFNIIAMNADDATYKMGLFLDKEGTIPFRSDYMKDIRLVNAHSGTAVWSNVPDGTYYVFELDENGSPMVINDLIEIEEGKSFYYNVTDAGENESNEAVISQSNSTESVSYVNNYYNYIPDGFSLRGFISINKKVLVDGVEDTVDDTFYASVFKAESDGSLLLVETAELKQNGTVTLEVSFDSGEEPESVEYTVMETDKEGNPIDKDLFPYEVSGEGDIILNKSERYTNSIDITNSMETEPDPDPTETPTPTPTKGAELTVTPPEQTVTPTPSDKPNTPDSNTPNIPNTSNTSGNDSGTTGRTSVKTGDDTPIGTWVGILAATIVVAGVAGFAVKRKKKK